MENTILDGSYLLIVAVGQITLFLFMCDLHIAHDISGNLSRFSILASSLCSINVYQSRVSCVAISILYPLGWLAYAFDEYGDIATRNGIFRMLNRFGKVSDFCKCLIYSFMAAWMVSIVVVIIAFFELSNNTDSSVILCIFIHSVIWAVLMSTRLDRGFDKCMANYTRNRRN